MDRAMTQGWVNRIFQGDWLDVAKGLPADTFHCCVTSPPYWGQRNYGCDGQLGLEKTPEEHIEKLVAGFREVRRILRPDGVLWLNYGDKYWGPSNFGGSTEGTDGVFGRKKDGLEQVSGRKDLYPKRDDLKAGDLIGLPWRMALALQADGWWLRSDVIWAKALSFCPTYSGSTMPESVNGWRWERCRVKIKNLRKKSTAWATESGNTSGDAGPGLSMNPWAQWADCPGCPKCQKNGGLVLRRGSWRCTKAHEYLFMLTRSERYFCDNDAVREPCLEPERSGKKEKMWRAEIPVDEQMVHGGFGRGQYDTRIYNPSGRNLRDVWTINPQAYKGAHYATFPEKLVEPCIKVSTSQKGVCPKCGAPWARVIETSYERTGTGTCGGRSRFEEGDESGFTGKPRMNRADHTIGWRATCNCGIQETLPALVYDPFMGSGTVAAVAARLGRNYCGSELSAKYLTEQAVIRVKAAEHGMDMEEARQGQGALFE